VRKRMERKGEKGSEEDDYFLPPTHCLSPSLLSLLLITTSPPSFLSIHFLTTYLPPSSQSSSLPLSLLLPLLYLSPSLLSSSERKEGEREGVGGRGWRERGRKKRRGRREIRREEEEGGREVVRKWMERNEGGEVVRMRIERKEERGRSSEED
jgi:hypothetical protein